MEKDHAKLPGIGAFKMSLVFLRRKSRILLLIGIAGSLFLCFQLFSFKVLSFSNKQQHDNHRMARILDEELEAEFEQERHGARVQKGQLDGIKLDNEKALNQDKKNGEELKVHHSIFNNDKEKPVEVKNDNNQLVRGTHITQAEDYVEKDGMFHCINSKEVIPFSQVNDDYCDCSDSSDEPGTAACLNSIFYCTFQKSDLPQFIQGSRVNDGVCDCCDGSDEWAGVQISGAIHLTGKRYKNSLSHTPCKDTCEAIQKIQQEDEKIRALGMRLKQTYIESGKKVKETDKYGPNGVFYQLSLTCFDHETSEYKYTFCPFKSVTQQKFPAAAIYIGKKPVWRTRLKGVYVLKMEGGDLSACPGGKQRSTVITFICGLSDHIIEMREDERCVYGMKFSTPAAC